MRVVELIQKKRNGQILEPDELKHLVQAYTDGSMPDYQMSAFLMAVFFQGMTSDELAVWADAMLRSGEVLDLSSISGYKVDKHSTGGVGDKVSLILAPLAVAAGVKVPMISGRGLGHTGGTLDKLESIPGFNVNLTVDQFKAQVDEAGCGLIGQTGEIAPADKKLYALRDVTATVECIPLIASSIMSKKLAEGIDGLVLDVKVGSGAFMKNIDDARELAKTMVGIGASMNKPVRALLTDMNQPLGLAVGNALEVIESIETLKGNGPDDLTDLTVELVAEMLELAGEDSSRDRLYGLLENGEALAVFRDIITRQGGNGDVCDDYSLLPTAANAITFSAFDEGYISRMNTAEIGIAAAELGAGRQTKEDEIDHAVGFFFVKKLGDAVDAGETVLEIHYNDDTNLENCLRRLRDAIEISPTATEHNPLILERLT